MGLSQLGEAVTAGPVPDKGVAIDVEWRPAQALAFQLGAPHAGTNALDNKVAFQLGDGSDDDDHGPAQRAASIDVLPEADELDVEVGQLVQHLKKVTHRAGDTIEGRHQHDVELAMPGVGQEPIESGTLRLGSAELVGVLSHDLEAALRGQAAQVIELGLRMLLEGGDTKIERCSLHQRRSFFFFLES